MTDQTHNSTDSAGLGIIFETEAVASDESYEAPGKQREVDNPIDEESTNELEQQSSPLRVFVDNPNDYESEAGSNAQSAFSSSSDEEGDADDEDAGAEDEDEDELDNDHSGNTPSPSWPAYVELRVKGFLQSDGEYSLYRSSANSPNGMEPYHSESDSSSSDYQEKKERHRKAKQGAVVRPSPLQITSDPDSPVKKKQCDWSGDDDSDSSWTVDATKEVRRSISAPGEPVSPIEGSDASGIPRSNQKQPSDFPLDVGTSDPVVEHDEAALPEVPGGNVGEIGEPEAPKGRQPTYDHTNAQSSDSASLKPKVGLELALKQGVPDENHAEKENRLPVPTANQPQAQLRSPTSPDPCGPETLTGLTPQEGLAAWREWHDRHRSQSQAFRANCIAAAEESESNGPKSGDLNLSNGDRNRDDAANCLRDQRLKLKEAAAAERYDEYGYVKSDAVRVANIDMYIGATDESKAAELEHMYEYMKHQMLRYRAQRNDYRYRLHNTRLRVCRRDAEIQDPEPNASIQDLKLQITGLEYKLRRRDKTVEANEEFVKALGEEYSKANKAYDEEKAKRKQLQVENQSLIMWRDQYKKSAEENAEKLRRSQAARGPLQMSKTVTVAEQTLESAEKPQRKRNGRLKCADKPKRKSFDFSQSTNATSTGPTITPYSGSDIYSTAGMYGPARNMYRRGSRRRRPAPEHHVNWPENDLPRVIDFIVEWINDYRENRSTVAALKAPQLETILQTEHLPWGELIEELEGLCYIFRADRLALALSDPRFVINSHLPRLVIAVLYAARHLRSRTAVAELLKEVNGGFTPITLLKRAHELENEKPVLEASQPTALAALVGGFQITFADATHSNNKTIATLRASFEEQVTILKARYESVLEENKGLQRELELHQNERPSNGTAMQTAVDQSLPSMGEPSVDSTDRLAREAELAGYHRRDETACFQAELTGFKETLQEEQARTTPLSPLPTTSAPNIPTLQTLPADPAARIQLLMQHPDAVSAIAARRAEMEIRLEPELARIKMIRERSRLWNTDNSEFAYVPRDERFRPIGGERLFGGLRLRCDLL
jgi:hypothetical protein